MKIKLIFVVLVCAIFAGEALSQSAAREGSIPGVTAAFIPFPEKDKIKFEDAVERAKENDPKAYYWLSYYFFNGDGVERDAVAGGKFLQTAVGLKDPNACYLAGLYFEVYALRDENDLFEGYAHLPENMRRSIFDVARVLTLNYINLAALKMPDGVVSDLGGGHFSYTNDVASGYVVDLYLTAVNGGLTCATNDIVRLKLLSTQCRERIAARVVAKEKERARSAAALNLLVDPNKEAEEARQQEAAKEEELALRQAELERERQEEEHKKQQEYWRTWPKSLREGYSKLVLDAEKKFNCVIDNGEFDDVWVKSGGKSLIVCVEGRWGVDRYFKIDSDGKIVAWTSREDDLEELKWLNEERERRIDELRTKWAEERGMSLEEAKSKYEEAEEAKSKYYERLKSSARSPEECRAVERKEQREQLLAIQEELRRVRESKVAAMDQ